MKSSISQFRGGGRASGPGRIEILPFTALLDDSGESDDENPDTGGVNTIALLNE